MQFSVLRMECKDEKDRTKPWGAHSSENAFLADQYHTSGEKLVLGCQKNLSTMVCGPLKLNPTWQISLLIFQFLLLGFLGYHTSTPETEFMENTQNGALQNYSEQMAVTGGLCLDWLYDLGVLTREVACVCIVADISCLVNVVGVSASEPLFLRIFLKLINKWK